MNFDEQALENERFNNVVAFYKLIYEYVESLPDPKRDAGIKNTAIRDLKDAIESTAQLSTLVRTVGGEDEE